MYLATCVYTIGTYHMVYDSPYQVLHFIYSVHDALQPAEAFYPNLTM